MRQSHRTGLMTNVLLLLLLLLGTLLTVANSKNPLRRMRRMLNLDALELPSLRALVPTTINSHHDRQQQQQQQHDLAAAKKLMEMELFERLLEGDGGSFSLSMPSAPSRPSPPSPPSQPSFPSTPSSPTTPSQPGGPTAPTPPTTPTEERPLPPTDDGVCCDPNERPDGIDDRPLCFEGSTCCSDGNWSCNEGDGSSTCVDGEGPICAAPPPVSPPSAAVPPPPTTPNEQQPSSPQFDTATCSDYDACRGLSGDCCPTRDGVLLDCCYGITPIPSVVIFDQEGDTSAPIITPTAPAAAPPPSSTLIPPTAPNPSVNSTPPVTVPSTNGGGTTTTPVPSTSTVSEPLAPSLAPALSPQRQQQEPDVPTLAPSTTEQGRAAKIQAKCDMSVDARSNDISAIVSGVSTAASLANTNSPQYKAYEWIDKVDARILCPNAANEITQRYVAAVLYFTWNGSGWSNCRAADDVGSCDGGLRWLSIYHECQWYGLECVDNTILTKITLKDNGLDGTLPSELFTLDELTGLSLDHNKNIGGTIPNDIGGLVNLEYIELDDNALRGTIPEALYGMTKLKAIDMNNNQLQGTLSDNIGALTELMVLQVEDNKLNGTIPWIGLALLEELLVLYVHGNSFAVDSSLKALCDVMDTRRANNPGYLQFMAADCKSNIACSCCSECF